MKLPETMQAIQLVGHGGFDKLVWRDDVPVPSPKPGQVLVNVTAAGVNNTDINTRIGWYSKSVTSDTDAGGPDGFEDVSTDDAAWNGVSLTFPRIQGADCTGFIVAVGAGVDTSRIGERVLVRTMMQDPTNPDTVMCWTMGSECDGAFAQFTAVPAAEAFPVECDWTDIELASIPCAYSTAESMLHRVSLGGERVLVTGASGGVGSAAIQLAKRRGAQIVAVAASHKADALQNLGATQVIDRSQNVVETLGVNSVDVVVDLVGGDSWPNLLEVLKVGGRYVTSGAIAGPIVPLDLRTLYLKDLTLLGSTYQPVETFKNLISYIEHNEISPLIAATFPLKEIAAAQEMFLAKKFVGKIVLTVPKVNFL